MTYIIKRQVRIEIENHINSLLEKGKLDGYKVVEGVRNRMAPATDDVKAVLAKMVKEGHIHKEVGSNYFRNTSGYLYSLVSPPEPVVDEDEEII